MKHLRSNRFSALLSVSISLASIPSLFAASGTWVSAVGGNWDDATTAPWSGGIVADGAGFVAGFTSDITAASTVLLNANRTIGDLTFSDNGASGSAWTLGGTGTLTLSGGSTSTVTTTTDATISAVLAGSNSLTKAGAGRLTLSGANTYSGGTVLSAGSVTLSNATGFGTGSISVTGNSAISVGTAFGNNIAVSSGATLSLSGGFINVNGIISGAGNVTATNSIHLRGTNTYTGNTAVTTGFLCIDKEASLGATPGTFNAASLTLSGGGYLSNYIAPSAISLNANRGITLASGNSGGFDVVGTSLTVNGIITGSGGFLKSGNSTLILTAQNTFTGAINVNNGELRSEMGTRATGTYTPFGTGSITVASGRTLRFRAGSTSNTYTIANAINLNGATLAYEDGNHILSGNIALTGANTVNGVWSGKTLRLNGILSGTGSLNHTGFSTLTLAGTNTYSGGTTLTGGTLQVSNTSALGTGSVSVTGNSTLTASTAFSNNIAVSTGVNLTVNGGFINLNGIISGAGGVIANNSIQLRGENTYTGLTSVTGGFLCIDRDRNLGAVPSSFTSNSLTVSGGGYLSNYIATSPVVLHANRGIVLASGNSGGFDVTGQTLTVQGVISGAGNLGKINNGELILNGTNTFTGRTSVSNGTLTVSSIGNVGETSGSSLGNVADATTGTIALGSGALNAALKYVGTGTTTDRVLNLSSTTGNVTLTQAGSGLLKFTSPMTTTGAGAKTLVLNGSTTGTGEIAGAIVNHSGANPTSLTKSGTGTWTLSGNNTYTGATTVSGGTLVVSGSLAATAVTVQSGATLDLSGTAGGTVSVESGGTLKGSNGLFNANVTISGIHSPGSSPGLQTFASGLTYGSTATLNIELLGDSLGVRGTDYDAIDVTGGILDISPSATLNLIASGIDYTASVWDSNRAFTLIDFSGTSFTGGVFNLDSTSAGSFSSEGAWSLSSIGGDTVLNWTAVPEPSSAWIGGIGILLLVRRRR